MKLIETIYYRGNYESKIYLNSWKYTNPIHCITRIMHRCFENETEYAVKFHFNKKLIGRTATYKGV